MKIQHHWQFDLIVLDDGREFKDCAEARNAANNVEWAARVLSEPCVTFINGRESHEVAYEIAEQAEDTLIDHQIFRA